MAFFAVIVVSNLVSVIYRSIQKISVLILIFFLIGLNQLNSVDSNSQGRAFLALSILLIPSMAVFFLPLSLSGRL